MIYETLEFAAAYAVLVIACVEALRKQVAIDGWRVLVVAGVIALGLSALFAESYAPAALLQMGRVAFASWLIAVGGDAWVSKIVRRSRSVVVQ